MARIWRYNNTLESRVEGFPTGLAGTVGVTLLDNQGNVSIPRITTGIIEDPAGSGSYVHTYAAIQRPTVEGTFTLYWDYGQTGPSKTAFEEVEIIGVYSDTGPLPGEIMASLDDINRNLPDALKAESGDTDLLQISAARIISAYLRRTITPTILIGWTTPANTPEIVREIAGKLIAAQFYLNETSKATSTIEDRNYGNVKYTEAMKMLQDIINGSLGIDGIDETPDNQFSTADFFPVDDTDRAFSMGMQL